MAIIIDNRKKDILYVDKENNHFAKTNNVIKLINNSNIDIIDIYISIVTTGIKLSDIELKVLKFILLNNRKYTVKDICDIVSKDINKAHITISRAINALNKQRFIFINAINIVCASNSIKLHKKDIDNASFIVIEVDTNKTNVNVNL